MHIICICSAAFAALLLSSCSTPYATKGEQLYLKSQNAKPIEVPKNLNENHISHYYDLASPNSNPLITLAPPGFEDKKHA